MYHYAGNNPIRYSDPTGRNDDLPSIDTLSASRIRKFNVAKENVIESLDKIISTLKMYDESSEEFIIIKNSAKKWLKIDVGSKEKSELFAKKLESMKRTLDSLPNKSIKYDEYDENIAYVSEEYTNVRLYGSSGEKTLVMCDSFFYNQTDREFALVHEMSHYCHNTKDYSYEKDKCLTLTNTNGQNWGFFYREVINVR